MFPGDRVAIFYEINKEDFFGENYDKIKEAFHDFQLNTCVHFQLRRKGDPNHLSFRRGNGCYLSSIGMKGGVQNITLNVRSM